MATETVSRAEFEEDIYEFKHLVVLAQWVEMARNHIDHIDDLRKAIGSLDERLSDFNISTGPEWGEAESSALVALMLNVERGCMALLKPTAEAAT